MNCIKMMETIYKDENPSLLSQLRTGLHTLFCPSCSQDIANYHTARNIMNEDFFPSSPNLEEPIMAHILSDEERSSFSAPVFASTRGWVIAGLILMISLASAFFGFDFQKLVGEYGMSFILPMGITIGIIITIYGALFIGSHLKEFSERLGL